MRSFRQFPKRESTREELVSRELGVLKVKKLNSYGVVWEFIRETLKARDSGFEEVIIDLSELDESTYFPNVLTPIAAFIENIKNESHMDFNLENAPRNIEFTNFINPKSSGLTAQAPSVLDKVWKFETPEDVFKLVTEYMDSIYKADVFEGEHVLSWMEWCLNEVMDNVIQHSEATSGFVMGQVHSHNKHIAFCVADAGRGIFESLRTSSDYWPKEPADALTLALKEGVTRDKEVGQGNGLWGLHEVVQKTSGKLTLSSSGNSLVVTQDSKIEIKQFPWLNSRRGGTVVDFQLDYSKPISLKDVLGGHEPESTKIFNATDEKGELIIYKLIDQKSGFGTRKSGERIRNEIINLVGESNKPVELDFKGVGVVSSSFADELVGKLYITFGPLKFSQVVHLNNMNDEIIVLINRAMEQRIRQELD